LAVILGPTPTQVNAKSLLRLPRVLYGGEFVRWRREWDREWSRRLSNAARFGKRHDATVVMNKSVYDSLFLAL